MHCLSLQYYSNLQDYVRIKQGSTKCQLAFFQAVHATGVIKKLWQIENSLRFFFVYSHKGLRLAVEALT